MRFPDVNAELDRLATNRPGLRFVLAVRARFDAVHGGHLAAAVAFQAALSLLPLLLLGSAIVGMVAGAGADVAGRAIESFGLRGDAATVVLEAVAAAERSSRLTSVLGLLGMTWAGLGLAGSLQIAFDSVWAVPNRGLRDRLHGLSWLVGAGVLFLAGLAATALTAALRAPFSGIGIMLSVVADAALWFWSFRVLINSKTTWRCLVPGALVGAVGLEILKLTAAFIIPGRVAEASALYGGLGFGLVALGWLALMGRLAVYAAAITAVAAGRPPIDVPAPTAPTVAPSA